MTRRVGFVGLGRMGTAMFTAVLEAGMPGCAFDVDPTAVEPFLDGPHDVAAATSPGDLAVQCDVVDIVVNTDQQVLDVCLGEDGILAASSPGTVVLVHSTIALDTLRTVAAAGLPREVHILDAPISGRWGHRSVPQLCVMVGGNQDAFERASPILETFGGLVLYLGPLGSGLDTKLALNVVRYLTMSATREARMLLAAASVDAPFDEIVEYTGALGLPGATGSVAPPDLVAIQAEVRDPDRLRNNAATARKDLRAAVARGRELGVQLPTAGKTVETIHSFWDIDPPDDFRTE